MTIQHVGVKILPWLLGQTNLMPKLMYKEKLLHQEHEH